MSERPQLPPFGYGPWDAEMRAIVEDAQTSLDAHDADLAANAGEIATHASTIAGHTSELADHEARLAGPGGGARLAGRAT